MERPIVQPVAPRLVDSAANLRRSALVAGGLGIASIVVLSIAGHPLMGVFFTFGLALGALNNAMLQRSVIQYASSSVTKRKFTGGVMLRLSGITIIAIAIALVIRPDGYGTFVGLAVFQILMLVGAAVPVLRSVRPTS
ncbi:MAG: hypothetical protein DLM58_02175 [Pseudonocardiales bacterium]|nr:MAG: hypothetical protein DLM58_02175 [Pseudonocardiales bacterium]